MIGWPKAIVAIARKLLIAVWHIWSKAAADRFAVDEKVAAGMYALAYKIGVQNLPDGLSARTNSSVRSRPPGDRPRVGTLPLGLEAAHPAAFQVT